MEFKGFDDWIEIFRGGKQVDSQGRTHNGDELIKTAVEKYNTREHEAPNVVGHPADNGPAFGWVEGLRAVARDGIQVLEAKFKQVPADFEEMVKQGYYRKRSAAFYPDGSLRHVGWLGAMPPAVKGLADVAFREGVEAIEFTEKFSNQGGFVMEITQFLEALKSWMGFTSAIQQQQPSQWPGQPAQQASQANPADAGKSFSEADLKKAEEAAAAKAKAEAKAEAEAQFAEQQAETKKQAREASIKAEVKALVDGGKLAPAFSEQVTQILLAADNGQEMEFAEGQKGSPADCLLATLKTAPMGQLFSEFATPGAAGAEFAEAKSDWARGAEIAAHVNPTGKKE